MSPDIIHWCAYPLLIQDHSIQQRLAWSRLLGHANKRQSIVRSRYLRVIFMFVSFMFDLHLMLKKLRKKRKMVFSTKSSFIKAAIHYDCH